MIHYTLFTAYMMFLAVCAVVMAIIWLFTYAFRRMTDNVIQKRTYDQVVWLPYPNYEAEAEKAFFEDIERYQRDFDGDR